MDVEHSQIVIEIVDEIIDACVNGTSIPENVNDLPCNEIVKSSGNEFSDDRSDAGVLQQNFDIVSNIADKVGVLDQFETFEDNCQPSNSNDEIRIIDEKCIDNVPNDKNCHTEQDNEVDREFSKSFSIRNFGSFHIAVNLSLLACANKISKYEIRCDGFPPKMMENELAAMFTKFGELYKVTKNTETNKTFVTFTNVEDAEKAIKSLDGHSIQGHRVHLHKQLPNRRLIVRNIPKSAKRKELFRKFQSVTRELISVSLYNDPANENMNRGFCYLEYPEHYQAAEAKRILSSMQLFHTPTVVEWPDRRFEWKETPETLYITNLRSSIVSRDLKRIFSAYGQLVDVHQIGNFGWVQFRNVKDAKRAATEIDKSVLGNENVEISSFRLSDEEGPIIDPNMADTLSINNLSATVSSADLRTMFGHYGNVLDIDIDRNNGCALVRFQFHEQAKRAAFRIDKPQLGRAVYISLVKNTADKSSNTLYISNLRANITTADLRKWFAIYGEVMEIDLSNDSATIRFLNPKNAEKAAHTINKQCMGDRVQISFGEQSENKIQKICEVSSNTLYIYNMYPDMTIPRLKKLFSVYGKLVWVDMYDDFGTVQFSNGSDSIRAAHEINRIHLGRANPEILFFPKVL